jgi:hypothetical protein
MQHKELSVLLAAALVIAPAACSSSSSDATGSNQDGGSRGLDSGPSTPVADSGGSQQPVDSGSSTPAPDGGAGSSTDGGSPASDAGQTTGGDGGIDATFTAVYTTIIAPTCSSHHSGATAAGALDLSSQAVAYTNLVGVHAAGGACGPATDDAGGPSHALSPATRIRAFSI